MKRMTEREKVMIRDVLAIKEIVRETPEAVEYLPPFQKKIVQALMREEGNTAVVKVMDKRTCPSP